MNRTAIIKISVSAIIAIAVIVSGYFLFNKYSKNTDSYPKETKQDSVEKSKELKESQELVVPHYNDSKNSNSEEVVFKDYKYDGTVLIFATENVFNNLKSELERLTKDIEEDLSNIEVEIKHDSYSSPLEIREIIKNYHNKKDKLRGSILIGDIPTFNVKNGFGEYASDWFYQDPNDDRCDFQKEESDVYYEYGCNEPSDSLSYRELFVGRITPPRNASNKIELIKEYLDKNHEFRNEKIEFENKFLFLPGTSLSKKKNYGDSRIENSLTDNLKNALNSLELYSLSNTDFINEKNFEVAKSVYRDNLENKSYEAAILNTHGNYTGQYLGEDPSLKIADYRDIKDIKPKVFYTNFLSCSNGAFNKDNYLTGWYIFKGNSLVANAQSVPAAVGVLLQDPPASPIHIERLNGLKTTVPIGEMIKRDSSFHATQTFGDPTLHLLSNDDLKNHSEALINKTSINFGKVAGKEKYKEKLFIKNEGENNLELFFDYQPSTMINDKSISYYHKPSELKWGANGIDFDDSISSRDTVEIKPGEVKEIGVNLTPYILKNNNEVVNGNYFQILEIKTNDPRRPYIDIVVKADVAE